VAANETSDVIIVGGGAAGLSLAAELAKDAKVLLLEAEFGLGAHASGRSVALSQRGIGSDLIQQLTHESSLHYLEDEAVRAAARLAPAPVLYVGDDGDETALLELLHSLRRFTCDVELIGQRSLMAMAPCLEAAPAALSAGLLDATPFSIDAAGLLDFWSRRVRACGGRILLDTRVERLAHKHGVWRIHSATGAVFEAPIIVNAAGAWADDLALRAGLAARGLTPMRRTVVAIEPPQGFWDTSKIAFIFALAGDFYALAQPGRLLASAADEVPSNPCDARPEQYDIAYTLDRLAHYTALLEPRIQTAWSGLRTFAPDRAPVVGFDADVQGFLWLAGQGGYGLQTAPALATLAAGLILNKPWPRALAAAGLTASLLSPSRLAPRHLESRSF
jgi:D-arginine dehydrogenase